VPVEEPVAENAKPSPTKKGAAGKKDAKAVEEITDNRPRVVNLKRDIAEECGGQGMRFTEPIVSKFATQNLVIHVIQDEKIIETVQFSLNETLWRENGHTYSWRFNAMKTIAIHYLEVKLVTQSGLLSTYLRKKLNPMMIRLASCKDIPFKSEPKYKPIFARVEFVDKTSFRTLEMP